MDDKRPNVENFELLYTTVRVIKCLNNVATSALWSR